MKLRLQITGSPESSVAVEHAGPVVTIGRDPACELARRLLDRIQNASGQGNASREIFPSTALAPAAASAEPLNLRFPRPSDPLGLQEAESP